MIISRATRVAAERIGTKHIGSPNRTATLWHSWSTASQWCGNDFAPGYSSNSAVNEITITEQPSTPQRQIQETKSSPPQKCRNTTNTETQDIYQAPFFGEQISIPQFDTHMGLQPVHWPCGPYPNNFTTTHHDMINPTLAGYAALSSYEYYDGFSMAGANNFGSLASDTERQQSLASTEHLSFPESFSLDSRSCCASTVSEPTTVAPLETLLVLPSSDESLSSSLLCHTSPIIETSVKVAGNEPLVDSTANVLAVCNRSTISSFDKHNNNSAIQFSTGSSPRNDTKSTSSFSHRVSAENSQTHDSKSGGLSDSFASNSMTSPSSQNSDCYASSMDTPALSFTNKSMSDVTSVSDTMFYPHNYPFAANNEICFNTEEPAQTGPTTPYLAQLFTSISPPESPESLSPTSTASAYSPMLGSIQYTAGQSQQLASEPQSSDSDTVDMLTLERMRKDRYLIAQKQAGASYKEIKIRGRFQEAESTLRGRYRRLTKPREYRVRRPQWKMEDLRLLREAVDKLRSDSPSHVINSPAGSSSGSNSQSSSFNSRLSVVKPRVSWKAVAQHIMSRGGSYPFGWSTCSRKWMLMMKRELASGSDGSAE